MFRNAPAPPLWRCAKWPRFPGAPASIRRAARLLSVHTIASGRLMTCDRKDCVTVTQMQKEVSVQSSWYGKVEKAHRYAAEKESRVHFSSFEVVFHGDNDEHHVTLRDGAWRCTCHFFQGWNRCCHTMAMEQVLRGMLTEEVAQSGGAPTPVAV